MDAKSLFGGNATRTMVDFASVVISGVVLINGLQIAWNLAGINFITNVFLGIKFGSLITMIAAILIGFIGGYVLKVFFPRGNWWEAIAPAGSVAIGSIFMTNIIDLPTCILLLDLLLGLYFWNFASCDVHMRGMLMDRHASSGYPWLAELVEVLLVPTGIILPFIVDPFIEYYLMIIYLVVLAGLAAIMIILAVLGAQLSVRSESPMTLAGLSTRAGARHFLDGRNIIRAVLLVFLLLLIAYYIFQAIQARSWFLGMPDLTFFYNIELYSISYYGIIAGAVAAIFVLQLAFVHKNYKILRIVIAIAMVVLIPGAFALLMVISDALNSALLFIFCQAAFVGMVFAFFIALLGQRLQVSIN